MGNRKRQAGFTLVEILIVVVILGILAAIVIPQFTQASESAKASSLSSQLQTIRSQIELYQIEHNGTYPDLTGTNPWEQLTQATTVSGDVEATGDFGPYLQQPPRNSFNNATAVAIDDSNSPPEHTASNDVGWVYNSTTGQIRAVLPANVTPADLGLSEEDVTGGDGNTEPQ